MEEKHILIQREDLTQRIHQLAREINQSYTHEEVILVTVLKGGVVFLVDLMKELQMDLELAFLYLSSYAGEKKPISKVREYSLPFPSLKDRHVLLIEDILDTGASFSYAWKRCQEQVPRSLKSCVLLVKDRDREVEVPPIDYCGFHIPNVFVVGYGLDYQEKYRNLPYIATM